MPPLTRLAAVATAALMLAGFTVGFVFLLSWGVGLLWTMGELELPSVIGAGVSGVPRRS